MGEHVKRNFAQTLKDFEGNEIPLNTSCDPATLQVVIGILARGLPQDMQPKVREVLNVGLGKPLTLSRVATMALGSGFEDERNLEGDERLERYKLGMRLKEGMVKVSPTDRDRIKKCVLKRFPESLVAPQALMMLEGESLEAAVDEDESGAGGGGEGGAPPA